MKFRSIFFFAVLYVLFSIPASLMAQEGLAGPDRYICPGGTTSIGNADLCRKCCTVWSPATGLSDPGSMHTEVNGIMNTTQYILHYTTAEGDLIADTVMVFVNTIDITLHKPAFIDPAESAIPAAQALQQGAQTMVNLDDDDGDLIQDDGDTQVSSTIYKDKDNEFIKIKIATKLSPGTTLPAFLEATINHLPGSNAASVKFWKSKDKAAGGYTPGDTLHLHPNSTGDFTGWVWVEGVSPHSQQKEVRFTVNYTDPAGTGSCVSAPVEITIIGIQQITWTGNGNGYTGDGRNNSNTLDVFSEPSSTSYRIFPESKMAAGAQMPESTTSDVANLEITLSTEQVQPFPIFIRLVDIDDPSGNFIVDPNDSLSNPKGNYIPSRVYTDHNDNRNDEDKNKEKAGLLLNATLVSSKEYAVYSFMPTQKTSMLKMRVSHFPGDNYSAAIYGDISFIKKVYNIDRVHKNNIVFLPDTANVLSSLIIDQSLLAPALTVWRTLHIEYDIMVNPTRPDNQASGYFDNFESIVAPHKLSSVIKVTGTSVSLKDLSPIPPGRFRDGQFAVGNPGIDACPLSKPDCVSENDTNTVIFSSVIDLTLNKNLGISLYPPAGGGGVPITFKISEIERVTTPLAGYKVTIVPAAGSSISSSLQGGSVSIGGGPPCINCLHVLGSRQLIIMDSLNNKSNLKIPFDLMDDDDIPKAAKSTVIKDLSSNAGILVNAFSEAYILPVIDGGGESTNNSLIPFIPNVNNVELSGELPDKYSGKSIDKIYTDYAQSALYESKNYWVAYIVSGWQFTTKQDADPDTEGGYFIGITSGNNNHCDIGYGGNVSVVFHETWRDVSSNPNAEHTFAHEIGHQFGLSHGTVTPSSSLCASCILTCNTGLMAKGIPGTNPPLYFSKEHLNLLRCRFFSPGKNN
ncbi:MAG: hypothetical protein J0L99_20230 [Chitinophagales bacterium]|nr:hypothetical protein [Chitinophagales bacterium]